MTPSDEKLVETKIRTALAELRAERDLALLKALAVLAVLGVSTTSLPALCP